MTRKEMMELYEIELKEMSLLESGDKDALLDKLIYEARVSVGDIDDESTYSIPSNIDLAEVYADYMELIGC